MKNHIKDIRSKFLQNYRKTRQRGPGSIITVSAQSFLFATLLVACETSVSPENSLEVAAKGIHAAAISDDASLAIVGSIHHGGSLWRVKEEERIFNWNHDSEESTTIVAADFSSNNNWAITASPFNLVLWNTASGRSERFWSAPGEILDAKLGPNANFAILGLSDHSAVIFNIRRGGILRTFAHGNRVRSVDLNREGTLALTGSEDYSANLWDVSSGEKLTSYKHEDDVQLVKLSPKGKLALSVSKYDKALIWRTSSGETLGEIPLTQERLKRGIMFSSARFNDEGSLLLTGRPDQIVELWDVATLSSVARWELPKRNAWKPTSAAVVDIGFTEDASTVYAIASNGFLHTLRY